MSEESDIGYLTELNSLNIEFVNQIMGTFQSTFDGAKNKLMENYPLVKVYLN